MSEGGASRQRARARTHLSTWICSARPVCATWLVQAAKGSELTVAEDGRERADSVLADTLLDSSLFAQVRQRNSTCAQWQRTRIEDVACRACSVCSPIPLSVQLCVVRCWIRVPWPSLTRRRQSRQTCRPPERRCVRFERAPFGQPCD